jgi:hypothetical protein
VRIVATTRTALEKETKQLVDEEGRRVTGQDARVLFRKQGGYGAGQGKGSLTASPE